MEKLLIINKPLEWTSMDVIKKIRSIIKIKKVGHAGTLDPLATGVLLVCTGKMTKKINEFMDMPKEYIAHINLTAFSETDDAEGLISPVEIKAKPTLTDIEKTIHQFIGDIQQTPPKFSAIKINGQRAYKKARNNEDFEMKPRPATIHSIDILHYEWPTLQIKVNCAKGTYIRSLARDIGTALQTGGYLSALQRTAIGPYTIEDSITLEQLKKEFENKPQ